MEPRDEIAFPAVTICPQKYMSGSLHYDFSGLFSPMDELVMSEYQNMVFSKLSGLDDGYQRQRTDLLPHDYNDINDTTDEGRSKEICIAPFAFDGGK